MRVVKKYSLLFILSAVCHLGFAQKRTLRPIRWTLKTTVCRGISVSSYPISYPTNSLISQYATNSLTFQVISAQRYFGNWGVEANLAIKFNQDESDGKFVQAIEAMHATEKYYYTKGSSSTSLVHSVGPVYKKQLGRFIVIGKGLIGVTSNKADSATAIFLSADRSTLHSVLWAPNHNISYHLIFNPGVSVMYRINNVFAVSLEISYWQMSNRLTYTETTADTSDDRVISQRQYLYSTPIRQVNFGFGLNFTL